MVRCYFTTEQSLGVVKNINSAVCVGSGSSAGFYQCCFPWDTCLPNGLCYAYNTTLTKTTTPQFYTSLCTDPTLHDSACSKFCGGNYHTGLKYNATSDQWVCCDKSDVKCDVFSNSTYKAPKPEVLLASQASAVDYIPTSTASTSGKATGSGSVSSSLQSATGTEAAQSSSSPGLGTGAIIGISIAAVLVVAGLSAGIGFWVWKGRRKTRTRQGSPQALYSPPFNEKDSKIKYHLAEMDAAGARMAELDGRTVHEMR